MNESLQSKSLSSVSSSASSTESSSLLATRDYLIRIKTSPSNRNYSGKVITLRIFDDSHHASEEVPLKKSETTRRSLEKANIDEFHIRTEQKLSETIRRLKLHTTADQRQQSENEKNERIFLKWIELTDLTTKRSFCFSVDDYLPMGSGDALELTDVRVDSPCEQSNQQKKTINNVQAKDSSTTKPSSSFASQSVTTNDKSTYAKFYDIRTKTGHQGFLGINSLMKAHVYLKLYDTHRQSSEPIRLTTSELHERPFRSNQTDQFQIGTSIKLGPLEKIDMWHDGKKGTRLHCDTLEITDRSNGQIYCFQVKEYLDGEAMITLTDYDNRRCVDGHSEYQSSLTRDAIDNRTDDNEDSSVLSKRVQTKKQSLQAQHEQPPSTRSKSPTTSVASSNMNINETLFKIRTRVGHKGFLSLGMGGTDANVYIRLHEGDKSTGSILLNDSLTHTNAFEAGHTDVFEISVPENVISPDRIEIFHDGKKHDGLYLKWIEIMNMNTLERKCFPINRWLDLNEGDKKTHLILTGFVADESCEENEYREHHTHEQYKTEYLIRTKTSPNQPSNNKDTHANIYLKIYNDNKKHTEDMLLSNSKHRTNPFRAGKIDKFEIGTTQVMDDAIDKIELWHDNKSDFNWLCEWIEIKNKRTGNLKCFGVNRLLSRKASDGATKIILTVHSHYPCEKVEHELHNLAKAMPIEDRSASVQPSQQHYHMPNKRDYVKQYIVTIKTGKQLLSGTDANVFIRLYDDQNRQSEDILLDQTITHKHPFQRNAIDEFHTGTWNDLSDLKQVNLWHTGGKNQGWYAKWLQLEDISANRLYCFPVNNWLDSNSNEKTTHVVLTEFTVNQPCSTKSDRKENHQLQQSSARDNRTNDDNGDDRNEQSSQFKQTYHVETKTGKRGFLGLSPTGTNAKVFMRIHDQKGQVSDPIELHQSTNHKNKFERGHTDGFDVGSSQSLDGINKLEIWHDDSGIGQGWFVDYVAVTDNKTGEEACFFIGKYLNTENGGVETKHLLVDKQTVDSRPCREHHFDADESTIQDTVATGNTPSAFKQTYRIETKTGHTGLFGLGGAGTNAPVFIRIHDNDDNKSEPIQLKHSLRHKNKFERNQTDQFDVGTRQNLDGVKQLELWHEGGKNDGWQVDYVQVIENKTGDSYCFLVHAMLDKNSGLKKTHILLEYPSMNVPCVEEVQNMKRAQNIASVNTPHSSKDNRVERKFTIRTKTGNQVEAGSTAPIHIQLFDDQDQKSEDIRLKHKDHAKHNFEPNAIDEFEVTSFQPLSNQLTGIRVKHNADKYQGWYAEWIEITDEDNNQTYCYPIQRWLDKAENDKQTNVLFTNTSSTPCDSLLDTMPQSARRSLPPVQRASTDTTPSIASSSQTSAEAPATPFKSTYHVKTKTGKKGFLGLSPTGTNARVYMRVIDKNGDSSEDLQLHSSTDHKNKFERGQTDEFDVGSGKQLDGIDHIELWTDGKSLGSGWFPEYVEVTDNQTSDVACFPVNRYLNQKNGGLKDSPLKLQRVIGDRSCQELAEENPDDQSDDQTTATIGKLSGPPRTFKNTFTVTTKTGHTGLFGLGAAGTNAPVFIRIHDTKGKISEAIQLKNSTRHLNKFERNQTDQFDIGTHELLSGVSRLELWHEGHKNDGWQVEYIQIVDNQTNTLYCFPVHAMLDENSGLKQTHILLEKPSINVSCPEQTEALKKSRVTTDMSSANKNKKKKGEYERNFTVRTKTGNQVEAGSTTPIHIQLFDDQEQSSEDIRLKHQDHEKHNFEPGAIDEFQVTSHQSLSNQLTGIRVKHNANKYQGWYCEWIEITDDDNDQTYCYPIQRWLDKAENDKKTDVYFHNVSDIPCSSLPDSTMETGRRSIPIIQKTQETESYASRISSTPFRNTYHVETKTGKKGFLGLSPTGTNADVYIQIVDRSGNKSEPIQLKGSTDHRNKFERGQIDEFDVGSTKSLKDIKQLEIWTDEKGVGHGWYADYVIVTDNKTGEEACFLIGEYLNKENGGVTDNHMVLDKQTGTVSCRERYRKMEDDNDTIRTRQMKAVRSTAHSSHDSSMAIPYKRTYHVDTKTGRKGFLGLSPTGTNADVHLRIHDKSGHISEPISLRRSTKHSNPFEKGKIDSFDIGTRESLESIAKIELYHDGTGLGHGWNVEYVNVLDNTTGHSYCFSADRWLNNAEHCILDKYVLDVPCEEVAHEQQLESKIHTKDKQKSSFTVRTKTGSQIEAGSTAPLYLRLFDDRSQKSEKIRLKQKDKDHHHFEPGSTDEFHITSDKPLRTLTGIEISHSADKYQGWYGEWISVTDDDTNETCCFPLQRWLDRGELDGKTDIYLKRIQTSIPCERLPDTMKRRSLLGTTPVQRSKTSNVQNEYKSNYSVQVKTAKKGLLGLAPTGTDANVFIQIHDPDGKVSEPIELKNTGDHKTKFARGQTDKFDVGSVQELNGVDKLEIWTDGKGIGSGWYPEYVRLTDQKTGETTCFAIEQYLNEKYGGSKNDHLLLNKQKDNRLCFKSDDDVTVHPSDKIVDQTKLRSAPYVKSPPRFQVEVKTGHTGFLGLGGAGTDAPVFVRIYDHNDRKSETFQLKNSINHRNKFERNQTDHFLFPTDEPLDDVSRVDLWHEGDKNDGWQVDYLNIIDNQSNTSYCFPINAMLDQNSGLKQTSVRLENPSINVPCKELSEANKANHFDASATKRLKLEKSSRNFTVRTKTGNHRSAGSTTPIHLQLIDINDKKSKDIQLKKKDTDGHHFAPGNIDEFKLTLPHSLSTLKAVKLSLDADKYLGWYGEWISVTDDDNQETYCFPIQRWLDKGAPDHKTHVTLYQLSNVPCNQLSDSMLVSSASTDNEATLRVSDSNSVPFDHTFQQFQIRTQTADKSLQGKLGRDANVYLNIYDKTNQQIGTSIPLQNSKNHKVPFQRHHTDKFTVTIPNTNIQDIDRIDLYHDGQNDGWFCDFVEVKNPQTNETKCFSVHQWLDKASDKTHFSVTNYQSISCDENKHGTNPSTSHYYIIRIKTNTTNLSSEDSVNTSIRLFGKSHQSEQIQLDRTIDNQQGYQRKNSIDIFEIRTSTKINSLERIEFYYNFQSNNGKLFLEWLEITNLANGMLSCFPINRLLQQTDNKQSKQQVLNLVESHEKSCSN